VLVDEWVTDARRLERDESLSEFVLRYFTGHGPATLRDFCWWSKVSVADAKIGLSLARDALVELACDGTSYFAAAAEVERAASRTARVHLLPGFDEYVLGYQDRALALPAEHAEKIVPGNNGIFLPMIVGDGRVIGTWRRSPGKAMDIAPLPFVTLDDREATAVERGARRYRAFSDPAVVPQAAVSQG
jgi:hypothetical protein